MALLMRRLFVDAQAKLRRMVEEHTANLTSRIEPECPVVDPPSASLARCSPPDPSSLTNKPLSPNQDGTTTPPIKKAVLSLPPPDLNTATDTSSISDSITSFDVKCLTELKKNSFSTARPSSIESTKKLRDPIGTSSKSASFDSNDIEITKTIKSSEFKALKLSKCSSIDKSKSLDIASDEEEGTALLGHEDVDPETNSMCSESKNNRCLSPGKHEPKSNQSTPESRPDSPQPGCSYFQLYEIKNSLHSDSAVSSRKNNDDLLGTTATHNANILKSMRLENDRLQAEVTRLKRLVVSGVSKNEPSITEPGAPIDCSPAKVHALEIELQLAREAISALKSDRKRLKAEKFDLLSQMKQLYATLEDKEKELRDFIRSYEQMRDSETSLQQLTTEREERERERWSLLRHARDEAERSLSLAAQLNAKELQLQQAQEQLQEARRQLAANGCLSDQESLASLPRHSTNGGAMTPGSGGLISGQHVLSLGLLSGDRGSCSADSGVRVSSDRESGGATSAGGNLSDSTTDGTPTITIEGNNVDVDSISVVSSIVPHHMYPAISTPKDCSPTLSPLNANNFTRSIDSGVLSRSVEQLNSPLEAEPTSLVGRRIKAFHSRPGGSSRGGTWGSISRVFARSRHRNKSVNPTPENESAYDPYRSWSPLTEEGYAEKLRLLREAASVPMEKWRAPTVLAWIEIALGMPQYGARCAENVKSGKIRGLHGQVLLELSDLELECGLGISHPMHRKKLRLAIEEHRHPNLVRYPCISQLGHTWVSSEWLPDLGLAQYSENFATNMVDARMLDNLSKKELEKFLGVTRKFHQASIVHGIHLLRIMKYDRQALAVRRHQCETVDADPLVWTNQRFIRWARNIDLGEYADNLKDSGVHGGLVVLEPSFNGDTMATALGVPPSKNMIRRHLMTELEALVLPARSTLEHYIRVRGSGTKHRIPGGSLGRSYSKSCAGSLATSNPKPVATPTDNDSRRTSIRGSFGRALGFKKSDRDKHSPTSSSESSSIISRINTPPPHFRSLSNESPVYAIPFAFQHSSAYSNISSKTNETLYENPSTLNYLNNSSNNYDISDQKNSFDECLHLNKNQISHRRVKSISDADGLVSPT